MTDWSKLKVAELKEECKSRDIPLTGLKLKQHFIDKLQEFESQNADDDTPTNAPVPEDGLPANGDRDISDPDDSEEHRTEENEAQPESAPAQQQPDEDGEPDVVTTSETAQQVSMTDVEGQSAETQAAEAVVEQPAAAVGLAPERSESHAQDAKTDDEADEVHPRSAMAQPALQAMQGTSGVAVEGDPIEESVDSLNEERVDDANNTDKTARRDEAEIAAAPPASTPAGDEGIAETESTRSTSKDVIMPAKPDQLVSDTSTPTSSQIPPADLAEDQRKRKRRSLSPIPTSEDIARKKARVSDVADATETKDYAAVKDVVVGDAPQPPADEEQRPAATAAAAVARSPSTPRDRSASPVRSVPPSLHVQTNSIYIRNFKRPLHIPSLRAHISSAAGSSSTSDTDPITTFHLDPLRTHAFISFATTKHAARARSVLHETRFPDEPMREPLWVDFVPTERVRDWIEAETAGGRGASKKWEVVYVDGQAHFQEVDQRARPPPPPPPSTSDDRGPPPLARSTLPPGPTRRDPRPAPREDAGRGFKALDELFSSTATKPKLYYKAVPDAVVRERLAMFRDLRVGHAAWGRSGDEGMKRYSFEVDAAGEAWVDRGPEFGYGRKGADRLAGRGRGTFRRGGDSWRGR